MNAIFNKEVLTAVLASLATMVVVDRVAFLRHALVPNQSNG